MISQAKPAPCRDCSRRHLGCHGSCAEYIEYTERCQQERDRRKAYATAIKWRKGWHH